MHGQLEENANVHDEYAAKPKIRTFSQQQGPPSWEIKYLGPSQNQDKLHKSVRGRKE